MQYTYYRDYLHVQLSNLLELFLPQSRESFKISEDDYVERR